MVLTAKNCPSPLQVTRGFWSSQGKAGSTCWNIKNINILHVNQFQTRSVTHARYKFFAIKPLLTPSLLSSICGLSTQFIWGDDNYVYSKIKTRVMDVLQV